MNLDSLVAKYLKYQEFVRSSSPHTLRAYEKDLRQAFEACKSYKVDREGRGLIDLCRQAQTCWGDLSPASRNRKTATLKSFLGFLFEEKHTATDLSLQLHSPKVPRKIPHFISVDEAIVCLKSFTKEDPPAEKVLFLLLYGGGLRVSEACEIKTSRLNLRDRSLRIVGKGKKERIVVFPKSVILEIKKLQKKKGEYLWGDKALDTRTAYEWIRKRGVKAGLLRPLHPHALRHSFATHMLTGGTDLRVLQELLGHESLAATEKYTHLGVDHLARTLEKHHPFGSKG